MDFKNLNLYIEKYKDISFNFKERLLCFLSINRFTKKDELKLYNMIDNLVDLKYNTIKIVFYIIPEPTPRPRFSIKTGKFYVKNAKTNNQFLKLIVDNEKDLQNLICTPCKFKCNTFFPIPNSMNRFEKILSELGFIRPITIPDWDNLGKTYSDMIQKYLLLNDSLIVDGEVHKYYSFKPRVELIIDYLVDFDCKYNRRIVEKSKYYSNRYQVGG